MLRASMGVDLDSACYVNKPEFGIECVTKVVDAAIENGVYVIMTMPTQVSRNGRYSRSFFVMPCQARRG